MANLSISSKFLPLLVGVSALILCLTIVTYSVTRISATEYLGSIEVKNTSRFKISINEAHATATDQYGFNIANFDVSNLPIQLEPGETATIEIPVKLSMSLEELGANYDDSATFHIEGSINYTIGIMRSGVNVSFSLTKAEIAAYSGILP